MNNQYIYVYIIVNFKKKIFFFMSGSKVTVEGVQALTKSKKKQINKQKKKQRYIYACMKCYEVLA